MKTNRQTKHEWIEGRKEPVMLIQKAHIRNVVPYLEGIAEGTELRIVAAITDAQRQKLGRLGFTDQPNSGETVLPLGVGAVSRFNVDGRWHARRD